VGAPGRPLEALGDEVPNRAPELPQYLALPTVEHLYRCVGLPVLKEAHDLASGGEQFVRGSFEGLLSYTESVHSLPP